MSGLSELTEDQRARAMRGSVVEGAMYAAMVGFGEAYFVADAVRLGATALAIGLVVALPLFVGSVGAILSHVLGSRGLSRKCTVLAGTLGQVIVFGALIGVDLAGRLTPSVLIALVCIYHLCGQTAGVAWASWFGDVVPEGERGRYFARRNRVVHSVICLSMVAGGASLQLLEGGAAASATHNANSGMGYLVIFVAAAVFRLVSSTLLARTPEPETGGHKSNPLRSLRGALKAGGFPRRVVSTAAALHVSVYLASPYFAAHMLETLEFSYMEYTIAGVASVIARVALLPAWGRMLDQHAARSSFLVALIGIALIPIPWLISGHIAVVVFAQCVSGVSWGGHELAQFSMILESVDRKQRTAVFAALGAVGGSMQLIGTLIGSMFFGWGGFSAVLLASLIARGSVALLAPRVLPVVSPRPHAARRLIVMRMIGVRPSGGLEHRPLPLDEES